MQYHVLSLSRFIYHVYFWLKTYLRVKAFAVNPELAKSNQDYDSSGAHFTPPPPQFLHTSARAVRYILLTHTSPASPPSPPHSLLVSDLLSRRLAVTRFLVA